MSTARCLGRPSILRAHLGACSGGFLGAGRALRWGHGLQAAFAPDLSTLAAHFPHDRRNGLLVHALGARENVPSSARLK